MNDFYSKLIKPLRDKHIMNLIGALQIDEFSPYDKSLDFQERLEPIQALKNQVLTWTRSSLIGLDKFPFCYIVNGNTEYLNIIFASSMGPIGWKKGDYSYYPIIAKALNKRFSELEQPGAIDNMVVSWPGYAYGDSTEVEFLNKCHAQQKHLDVAYLGLVEPQQIAVDNFSTVGISFSKTLAIPYNRIAMVFSQTEIPMLALMNKIGYVNLSGVKIANRLLQNLEQHYWWNKYSKLYYDIMIANDITPTKCILTAYRGNARISSAPLLREHLT